MTYKKFLSRFLEEMGANNVKNIVFANGQWTITYKNGIAPNSFEFFEGVLYFIKHDGDD